MVSSKERKIGLLAIEQGLLSQKQFEQVVAQADQAGKPVKEILLESGYLNRTIYNAIKQCLKGIISQTTLAKIIAKEQKGQKSSADKALPMKTVAKPGKGSMSSDKGMLSKLIRKAYQNQATDIHLGVGLPPYIRLHGQLMPTKYAPVTAKDTRKWAEELLTEKIHREIFQQKQDVTFSLPVDEHLRVRYHLYEYHQGIAIGMRLYPQKVYTLAQLGMPPEVTSFLDYQQGLLLFTGPKGSGKSTSMLAFVETINQSMEKQIIAIEDPIEVVLRSKRANVIQREVGEHTQSLQEAIRAALREDPDVLMVGELRDKQSISMAVAAAETGHLVVGTLQTGNAASTISRIINSFSPKERSQIRIMLAETLKGVISHRLVPNIRRDSRHLALEVLVVNAAAANFIRDDKLYQLPSLIHTSSKAGMISLEYSLRKLVQQGKIAQQEALALVNNKEQFKADLQNQADPTS